MVQGEGEGGIWGKKRLLSSVPLLETFHCLSSCRSPATDYTRQGV